MFMNTHTVIHSFMVRKDLPHVQRQRSYNYRWDSEEKIIKKTQQLSYNKLGN